MNQYLNKARRNFIMAIGIAVPSLVAAAWGLVLDYGGVLAGGLAVAVAAAVLLPSFYHRITISKKIAAGNGVLLRLDYTDSEAGALAQEQKKLVTKLSRWVAVLIGICLVIIALPFLLIARQAGGGNTVLLLIALAAALLLTASVALIALLLAARQVSRLPCITLISQDYLILGNLWHSLNDR